MTGAREAHASFTQGDPMDAILTDISSELPELSVPVMIARLTAAALLAGLIGLDRELLQRSAGLRTHMLVSLAAAAFTIVMSEIVGSYADTSDHIRADPIRIIEAVTAGVAFLAAGSIIQARGGVRGLTTGAGLWLAGAIGLSVGAGYWTIAVIATVIGFIVITALRFAEAHLPGASRNEPPASGGVKQKRK